MSTVYFLQGFGHAVLCAKEFVGNEPFLVLLGDHVYTTTDSQGRTCAQQLIDVYNTTGKARNLFLLIDISS